MILTPRIDGGKGIRTGVGVSLLFLVTLEASLLGSGRLIEFGPLTMKMWLFLAAQLYVFFRLMTHERIKLSSAAIILSLFGLLCIGAEVGVLQHSTSQLIGDDISPLLYCTMLIYFDMVITTKKQIHMIIHIIESAAMCISLASIAVTVLLLLGLVSYLTIYRWLPTASDEFLFRGESGFVFYKGSIYIAVGLIFFTFKRKWRAKIASFVAILGLLATGTRGYAFSLLGVLLVHCVTAKEGLARRLRYFIVPSAAAIMVLVLLFSGSLIGKAREESDTDRIATIHLVAENISPLSIMFGHGLGASIARKPFHMEISYLEIFHKLGLLGLTWWASIFALLLIRYCKARRINYIYAQPLFLSALFVIIESTTNPYVNNPIGMFIWITALVSLDVVSKADSPAGVIVQRESSAPDQGGLLTT